MPTMLLSEPAEAVVDSASGPCRKKWTREEVAAIAESGAVDMQRLELVEGELLVKMKNRPHVNVQHRIVGVLNGIFGFERVTMESDVDVAGTDRRSSRPVPDVVVTERVVESFEALPLPHEVSLIVEVSDTTLRYDLQTKAGLYARAGSVEYWVADLNDRVLIVHRQPEKGLYQTVTSYSAEESASPLTGPQASIVVGSLFPSSQ